MGLFVYFSGDFECVRCRRTSHALFQTKLLRHEAENFAREYKVGDSEILDGLGDYCALYPWDGRTPLVVAVGDWECEKCGLNRQWAKAVFSVKQATSQLVATISELSGLQPHRAEQLAGVHFVEEQMARLSGLWEPPCQLDLSGQLVQWRECSVPERCERVAAGFRSWCSQVADVDTH